MEIESIDFTPYHLHGKKFPGLNEISQFHRWPARQEWEIRGLENVDEWNETWRSSQRLIKKKRCPLTLQSSSKEVPVREDMLSVEPSAFDPSKKLQTEPALLNGASHNYKESWSGITYADALAHPQLNNTIPHHIALELIR